MSRGWDATDGIKALVRKGEGPAPGGSAGPSGREGETVRLMFGQRMDER